MSISNNIVNLRPETLTISTILEKAFEGHPIRASVKDTGEVLFVLKDICDAVEIGNSRMVFDRLDDDQKDVVSTTDITGRSQQMQVVTEAGLYEVLITSRKPKAKELLKFVTTEVLPEIRKTGSYNTALQPMTPAEMLLAQAQINVEIERRQLLQAKQLKELEAKVGTVASEMNTKVSEVVSKVDTEFSGVKSELETLKKEFLAVPPQRKRDMINEVVRQNAPHGTDFSKRYRDLYARFLSRYRIDLVRRAKNAEGKNLMRGMSRSAAKVKPITIAEEIHMLHELYLIAVDMYGSL